MITIYRKNKTQAPKTFPFELDLNNVVPINTIDKIPYKLFKIAIPNQLKKIAKVTKVKYATTYLFFSYLGLNSPDINLNKTYPDTPYDITISNA